MNVEWDDEADIVVVGFGGAGSAAAITAADNGASVLLLEKQAADAHTPSTLLSGGRVMGVNDADKAEIYLDHCASGLVPREVSRAWAQRALHMNQWLKSIGIDYTVIGGAEQTDIEGYDSIEVFGEGLRREWDDAEFVVGEADPKIQGGVRLFKALKASVEARPAIRVMWEAPASRLVRDETGRIVGVDVTTPEGPRRIGARKGVVLTCGGYEFDEELKLNYLRAPGISFYGNPGNTGDGVRMAQAVGADLWHMNHMIGRAMGHFPTGDGEFVNLLLLVAPPGYLTTAGYVLTDKHGRRFTNEFPQAMASHGFYHHLIGYDPETHDYPRIPCYWFFDQKRMTSGPLPVVSAGAVLVGTVDWSKDNRAEVERGWIKEADTIEEAARLAGVSDPAAAAREVEAYNEACATGVDAFGRPVESLVPLDEGPFYCVAMYPGGSNTTGGPRRNERAEVVNPFGEPIPGLYAAGELGQASGALCPSNGCNLSEAFVFGMIAVESALGL